MHCRSNRLEVRDKFVYAKRVDRGFHALLRPVARFLSQGIPQCNRIASRSAT
jgi:hypothetical protein